jgi:signal peptidase II
VNDVDTPGGRSSKQRAATFVLAGTVAAVVVFDQLTKTWAVNELSIGRSIKLLLGVRLVHARNTGVAFSKGGGMAGIIIPILVVIGVISWTARNEFRQPGGPHRWAPLAYGLILGGAFGNVIDRLFRGAGWGKGAVVDMIEAVTWWPVFNVADAALSIGVVLTLITVMRGRKTHAVSPNPTRSSPSTEESS